MQSDPDACRFTVSFSFPDTDTHGQPFTDAFGDAATISCPDCGSHLLARLGDSISHGDGGSHVFTPGRRLHRSRAGRPYERRGMDGPESRR